ncbi:MAG: DUF2254 domain-containing protein [Myxococcales bacterium]|nr:DUF2254 domain-containing protein [Myxococcales bacterium]
MLILGSVAVVLTGGLYTLDHFVSSGDGSPVSHYLNFSPEAVSNSIGVLSSIIAAVLGIILTVVSIVVQLSATRYTPAVTEMFFRDRTNMLIMGLYVVGCVMGFWIAFGVNDDWVPRISLIAMLSMATLGFLLMAPYFAYVFRLLSPHSIVSRIEATARAAAVGDGGELPKGNTEQRQQLVLAMSEQLSDVAINSILQKDKIIAIACVDALRDLSTTYITEKKRLNSEWFKLSRSVRHNPDFGSMDKDAVISLEKNRTWVEFKILRQYQSIYTEALASMRHLNYVVAINTRLIAERCLNTGNEEALALAIKFFNTYLRATLNNNDVRTAYTILNQYRLLAEAILRKGQGSTALAIAEHLKYYAHLSYNKKLGFVTETVAYDVGMICEIAHDIGSEAEADLLKLLLEVDPTTSEGDIQEASLRGVRKAQLKLATYYLESGSESLAKLVWEDMRNENVDRMRSIRDELLSIESREFWEVSDRGGNFDYLDPARKEKLKVFFGWFRQVSGAMSTVSLEAPPESTSEN